MKAKRESCASILAQLYGATIALAVANEHVTSPTVASLDRLHSKHVLPGFSDKTAEEREIAALTSEITRELRKCQNIILKIANHAKNMPLSTTSKEDRVMLQNVQTALATKVQDTSAVFRKKQSNYLKREFCFPGSAKAYWAKQGNIFLFRTSRI